MRVCVRARARVCVCCCVCVRVSFRERECVGGRGVRVSEGCDTSKSVWLMQLHLASDASRARRLPNG